MYSLYLYPYLVMAAFPVCAPAILSLATRPAIIRLTTNRNRALPATPPVRRTRKPDWIRQKVLLLAVYLPDVGCRALAAEFNRQHPATPVGKTWVANLLRQHAWELLHQRQALKSRPPRPVKRQTYWGLDLTFYTDAQGQTHPVAGLCEHHSRRALVLQLVSDKRASTLLALLEVAVHRIGPPRVLLTDNEAVFTCPAFRQGVAALGIRHRLIPKGKPWHNGRIERLFGTLKGRLRCTHIADASVLDAWLAAFECWYNRLRPHQNLHGWTPMEAWQGYRYQGKRWRLVRLWHDDSLNGYCPSP